MSQEPYALDKKPFRLMHFCITGVSEHNAAVKDNGQLLVGTSNSNVDLALTMTLLE